MVKNVIFLPDYVRILSEEAINVLFNTFHSRGGSYYIQGHLVLGCIPSLRKKFKLHNDIHATSL
jgi:hypothetical protein